MGKDCYLIIDGQQRITTISLLFAAMVNLAEEGKVKPKDDKLSEKIKKKFLVDEYNTKDRKLRLKPIKDDCFAFDQLFTGDSSKYIDGSTITANYRYFYDRIQLEEISYDELYDSISRLEIIDIFLDEKDDPQLIFESLNSTGLDLTEGDKIRNFILMGLDADKQETYYENYWNQIEKLTRNSVSEFIRHYLTLVQNKIPNIDNVYSVFKQYVIDNFSNSEGLIDVEPIVEIMRYYAQIFSSIINASTESKQANVILNRLNRIEMGVIFPFLLKLIDRWNKLEITQLDVEKSLRCIESYILRRMICEKPTNALNKVFCTLDTDVMKIKGDSEYSEVLIYILESKSSSSAFPADIEFIEYIGKRNVYSFNRKNRSYLLDRLENGDTREHVNVSEMIASQTLTVEHIMPQELSDKWKQDLGNAWQDIHAKRLNTLPNLTLTAYNSKYSNHPFSIKKTVENGFNDSPLLLNMKLKEYDKWTENEMNDRQKWITARMLELWQYPQTSFVPPERITEEATLEDGAELKGRKLVSFSYGESYVKSADQWVDMFVDVVQQLYNENPSILRKTIADGKCADLSFKSGPKENDWYKVAADIFVCKANSTSTKMKILNTLFEEYDKDPTDLVFNLKPEK